MLKIDRVTTQMDLLPSAETAASQGAVAPERLSAILLEPKARDQIKEVVLEVLKDHLRELERRGAI